MYIMQTKLMSIDEHDHLIFLCTYEHMFMFGYIIGYIFNTIWNRLYLLFYLCRKKKKKKLFRNKNQTNLFVRGVKYLLNIEYS